jgi:hypothetical protein
LTSQERKEQDVWNINNTDSEGIAANILFNFLVSEGDLDPEEDSVYDLEPLNLFYRMYQFRVPQLNRNYAVDDYGETETTIKEYLKEYFKDEDNLNNISDETLKDNLDEKDLIRMIRDVHEDWVYDDPGGYLGENQRDLNGEQESLVNSYNQKILKFESEIEKLAALKIDDKGQQKKIDNYLEKLISLVEDYNLEMEEIKENPKGDWFEWAIEEYIDNQVEYYSDDLLQFIADHDMPYSHVVNMESLIDSEYENNGYDVLPTYDGKAEEVYFDGETYVILRLS